MIGREVRGIAAGRRLAWRPVDFPPAQNGLDYLLSVVEHLAGEPPEWSRTGARRAPDEATPHQLKYAVMHLQAAAEVLLKYRLQREHPVLKAMP